MEPFAYERASSLASALNSSRSIGATFLAGGTEILNLMRLGIASPERVIDISRLNDLKGIHRMSSGGLYIGALATLNEVGTHPEIITHYPVLSQAVQKSASSQLRNLATIGGNPLQRTRCAYFRQDDEVPCNKRTPSSGCSAINGLNDKHAIFGWNESCVATHPADPPVALAALDTVVVLESAEGQRRLAVQDLIMLPSSTSPEIDNALRLGELVIGYEVPAPFAPRSVYLKIRDRESYEFATVSCAVALVMNEDRIANVRIALGSVAHRPWRLHKAEAGLLGTRIGSKEACSAVDESFLEARALSMNAYKIALARNAVTRALDMASKLV